jgi:hypothetical protein
MSVRFFFGSEWGSPGAEPSGSGESKITISVQVRNNSDFPKTIIRNMKKIYLKKIERERCEKKIYGKIYGKDNLNKEKTPPQAPLCGGIFRPNCRGDDDRTDGGVGRELS